VSCTLFKAARKGVDCFYYKEMISEGELSGRALTYIWKAFSSTSSTVKRERGRGKEKERQGGGGLRKGRGSQRNRGRKQGKKELRKKGRKEL
jgi:hypothetical protein